MSADASRAKVLSMGPTSAVQLPAALARIGALPQWAEVLCTNFLLGGQAWAAAEKAKLADLNWQIVVQKPP